MEQAKHTPKLVLERVDNEDGSISYELWRENPREYILRIDDDLLPTAKEYAEFLLLAANNHDALKAALRDVLAKHEYETPAGNTNCRFCDNNMDHEGTYENMHADDCVIHDVRAALAAAEEK